MFSDSTWTWSLPADGSVFLFSNRLLMTNQWILWAILHPILRETPHWQKMKTWWHGSCRIAIPCHTGMYIHVYSVLLCLCHYVQYETGDSTKNNRVYSCVRIENCTPLGAKTSHEQLNRGCHRAFSSPFEQGCSDSLPKHTETMSTKRTRLWPNYGHGNVTPLTPPSFYLNKHRTLVGLTKPTFTPLMCGVWGFQCLVQYGNLRRIQWCAKWKPSTSSGNDGWMILPKTLVSRNWTTRECCLLIRYLTVSQHHYIVGQKLD